MRNLYYPLRASTPNHYKFPIKNMVFELEKQGFTICNSGNASKYFARKIQPLKRKGIIKSYRETGETVYVVQPGYKVKIVNPKLLHFKII